MFSKKRLISLLLMATMLVSTATVFATGETLTAPSNVIGTYMGDTTSLTAGRVMSADFIDTVKIDNYLFMTRGSHYRADTNGNADRNVEGHVLVMNVDDGSYFKLEETGITNAEKSVALTNSLGDDESLNFAKIATSSSSTFVQYHFIPSKLVYDETNKRLYVGYVAYGEKETTPNWNYGGLRVYDVSTPSVPKDITGTINTTVYNYNTASNAESNAKIMSYTIKAPLQFNTQSASTIEPSGVWDMLMYDGILYIASNWGLISLGVLNTSTADAINLYYITHCNNAANYDINTTAATIYSKSDRKIGGMQSLYLDTVSGASNGKVYIWAANTYQITRYQVSDMKYHMDEVNKDNISGLRVRTGENRWSLLWPAVAQLRPGTSTTDTDHAVGSTNLSETHLTVEDGKVRIFAAQHSSYVLYTADISEMSVTWESNHARGNFSVADPKIISGDTKDNLITEFESGLTNVNYLYAHGVQIVGDIAYYGVNGGYIFVADLAKNDGTNPIDVIDIERVTNSGVKFVSNLYIEDNYVYAFAEGVGLLKYSIDNPLNVEIIYLDSEGVETTTFEDVESVKYTAINMGTDNYDTCAFLVGAYKNVGENKQLLGLPAADMNITVSPGKTVTETLDIDINELEETTILKGFFFKNLAKITPATEAAEVKAGE